MPGEFIIPFFIAVNGGQIIQFAQGHMQNYNLIPGPCVSEGHTVSPPYRGHAVVCQNHRVKYHPSNETQGPELIFTKYYDVPYAAHGTL